MIIFESQDHQELVPEDHAESIFDSIRESGTIEGEAIDALFELKPSHPWYQRISNPGERYAVEEIEFTKHYFLSFSRSETSDWMEGFWMGSEGWTSHSSIVWRRTPAGFVRLSKAAKS